MESLPENEHKRSAEEVDADVDADASKPTEKKAKLSHDDQATELAAPPASAMDAEEGAVADESTTVEDPTAVPPVSSTPGESTEEAKPEDDTATAATAVEEAAEETAAAAKDNAAPSADDKTADADAATTDKESPESKDDETEDAEAKKETSDDTESNSNIDKEKEEAEKEDTKENTDANSKSKSDNEKPDSDTVDAKEAKDGEDDDDGEKKSDDDSKEKDDKDARAALILEEDLKFESEFMSFPEKLMSLLDGDEVSESMWWLQDGDAFCLTPAGFAEKVLDHHFQGTKFESFTRKLNRWGFKRVAGQKVPPLTIAYYHHDFMRGKPELIKDMSGSKNRVQASRQLRMKKQQIRNGGDDDSRSKGMGKPGDIDSLMAMNNAMRREADHAKARASDMAMLQQEGGANAELQMRMLREGGGAAGMGMMPGQGLMSRNMMGLGNSMTLPSNFDPVASRHRLALMAQQERIIAGQMRAEEEDFFARRMMMSRMGGASGQADPASSDLRARLLAQSMGNGMGGGAPGGAGMNGMNPGMNGMAAGGAMNGMSAGGMGDVTGRNRQQLDAASLLEQRRQLNPQGEFWMNSQGFM